jgi:cell division protein ZapE
MSVLTQYRALAADGSITPEPRQEAAAERLDRLAFDLAEWRPGFFRRNAPPRGVYLWGDVGRGKSMLMDLFFAAAEVTPKRRVHFNDFMAETHALLHDLRKRESIRDPLPEAAKRLEQRLLCFDEFQVEDVADAMILGRLFDHLLARGTVIVATSNTPPDRLYQHGLNRQLFLPFIATLKARLDVVHLTGSDHRRAFSGDAYQTGPGAAAAMDAVWASLGGDRAHATTLTVLGRRLPVPRAVEGATRFSFAELCERPLGPADYLALAGAFTTLVIDAIPVFGPASREAAKRFQVLIDILYDRGVRLFCSAAAAPDALFPESDGFARTVSRLLEMRSSAYISRACSGTSPPSP